MNSTKWKISASSFSTYIQFILFSYFLGGLAFLGRINTRVYTKLLHQYQTVQRCAVPTKPIFQHLEQVKFKFWGRMGGSTSTLDGVYHCKIDKRSEWICTKLNEWRGWFFLDLGDWWFAYIPLLQTDLLPLLDTKFDRHPTNFTTWRQLNAL